MFGLILNKNIGNFQPREVADRFSETQPQVVENLNKLSELSFLIRFIN